MDLEQSILAAVIGLVAGLIGGLAGIGGSMVMLPGLAIVFGFPGDPEHSRQHTYQAAAMCVNVLVALPATVQHALAGAVRRDLVIGLLPAMCIGIIAGVLISNVVPGEALKNLLAAFIAVYCVALLYRVVRPRKAGDAEPVAPRRGLYAVTGTAAGLVGGILGLGGGVVTVPMLNLLARVRLRQAIAASSATMCISAAIGAALKLWTLPGHGRPIGEALWLVLAMGPMAVAGALVGARLAHALPLRAVRLAISILLLIAAARMALAS